MFNCYLVLGVHKSGRPLDCQTETSRTRVSRRSDTVSFGKFEIIYGNLYLLVCLKKFGWGDVRMRDGEGGRGGKGVNKEGRGRHKNRWNETKAALF